MKVKTQYLANDKNGRYSNILAQIYLKEAYDIEYGLYDHDDPELSHPFQFHLMTEKKMTNKFGLFRYYLRRYHRHQIQKYFGLNFLEFIQLPMDKVDDVFEMTNFLAEEETKQYNQAEQEMHRRMGRFEENAEKGSQEMNGFNIQY